MFIRPSKFRHVFGCPFKKEACYEGLKATKSAHDTNFCAVNPLFVAVVVESSGGGSFVVLPIEKTGRVEINAPKVCGHRASITDLKWCPHNDYLIASSSDDTTIKIWSIPDEGLFNNITEPVADLDNGHHKRVSYIEWHPCAQDVLLSAGADHTCLVWDVREGSILNVISIHPDMIFSISWNFDGSLFVTSCKDKVIRVIEPRSGDVVAEGAGHQGNKAAKAVFLNGTQIFTTGFSRTSERQYALWDYMNLSKPIKMEDIDSSCGTIIPFFDSDLNIVYLAGKGDGNIRYAEIIDQSPFVYFLNQFQSSIPQRGLGMMPKKGLDMKKCEIARFYKLHSTKDICEPISMIVPRKSDNFQTDIYPPTASTQPSLTAEEWMSGVNKPPILIKLEGGSLRSANYRTQTRGSQHVADNNQPSPTSLSKSLTGRSRSLHRDNPSVARNNTFSARSSTQVECYNSATDLAAHNSLRKPHGMRRKRRTRTLIGLDDEPRSSLSSYDDEDNDSWKFGENNDRPDNQPDRQNALPYNGSANRLSNGSTSAASHDNPIIPREQSAAAMFTPSNAEESFPDDATSTEDFKVQNVLVLGSRCEVPDEDSDRHGSRAMLDCISVDAPDDGVILPSKLRASMTSRHRRVERGRVVASSFAKKDDRPPNSELQGLIRVGSVREKSRNYNSIIGRDIFRKAESTAQLNTENKGNNNMDSDRNNDQDNGQATQTSLSPKLDISDASVKIEERSGNVQQLQQSKPSLGKASSVDQNSRSVPVKTATARVLPIWNNSSVKKPGRSLSDFKSNETKNNVQLSRDQNGIKSTSERRINYGERKSIVKSQEEINPKHNNNNNLSTAPAESKKSPPKQAISMSHTELLQEYLKQQQEIKRLKSQLEQRDARVKKMEEELSKCRNRRMI